MKHAFIVFFLLLSILLEAQVSKRHYKILSDKDEVGHLIATKKDDGDIIKYEISSDVTIRIIFKVQMKNEIQAVYKQGVLVYSSATLYLNGNVYSDTKIEKENGYYIVNKDGHETKIYSDGIRSSSAKLYFVEPIGEEISLSETEGEIKDLDIQGVRKYLLTENGSERSVSTYVYSPNEGLNQIEMIRPYVPELHIYRMRDPSLLDKI